MLETPAIDVNKAISGIGVTPIELAVQLNAKAGQQTRQLRVIRALIERKADPNTPFLRQSGRSVLHAVSTGGAAKLLLDAKANIDATDDSGETL